MRYWYQLHQILPPAERKHRDLGMLTVIISHRAAQQAEWTGERLETDTAIGTRVTLAGKPTVVAFRKSGVGDSASCRA